MPSTLSPWSPSGLDSSAAASFDSLVPPYPTSTLLTRIHSQRTVCSGPSSFRAKESLPVEPTRLARRSTISPAWSRRLTDSLPVFLNSAHTLNPRSRDTCWAWPWSTSNTCLSCPNPYSRILAHTSHHCPLGANPYSRPAHSQVPNRLLRSSIPRDWQRKAIHPNSQSLLYPRVLPRMGRPVHFQYQRIPARSDQLHSGPSRFG
jgi:hypothetical protein